MARVVDQGNQTDFDRFLKERVSPRLHGEIRRVIREALARPKKEWPRPQSSRRSQRMSPAQRARYERLRAKCHRVARELGLEPSFVASKAVLVQLATARSPEGVPLYEWQRRLLLG